MKPTDEVYRWSMMGSLFLLVMLLLFLFLAVCPAVTSDTHSVQLDCMIRP